jgi:hypothetical protein
MYPNLNSYPNPTCILIINTNSTLALAVSLTFTTEGYLDFTAFSIRDRGLTLTITLTIEGYLDFTTFSIRDRGFFSGGFGHFGARFRAKVRL